ncbi:12500_t:CDS:2 [Entrophospora sp. SA101]|nr:12500_t:CDS:2 [Entrophospora sp. SA101]
MGKLWEVALPTAFLSSHIPNTQKFCDANFCKILDQNIPSYFLTCVQLNTYIQTVIKGDAKRSNSGVCSKQIKIEDNGKDRLKGYVVMVIGRKDILTHSTAIISTCFNYNMAT